VQTVSAGSIADWRDSRLSFNDTPLEQVLAEFERYGPTGVVVPDSEIAALRVTGTFDPRRFERFASVLPRVLPVRLKQGDGVTEIVPAASTAK
jgi:transmembrane sensor